MVVVVVEEEEEEEEEEERLTVILTSPFLSFSRIPFIKAPLTFTSAVVDLQVSVSSRWPSMEMASSRWLLSHPTPWLMM